MLPLKISSEVGFSKRVVRVDSARLYTSGWSWNFVQSEKQWTNTPPRWNGTWVHPMDLSSWVSGSMLWWVLVGGWKVIGLGFPKYTQWLTRVFGRMLIRCPFDLVSRVHRWRGTCINTWYVNLYKAFCHYYTCLFNLWLDGWYMMALRHPLRKANKWLVICCHFRIASGLLEEWSERTSGKRLVWDGF